VGKLFALRPLWSLPAQRLSPSLYPLQTSGPSHLRKMFPPQRGWRQTKLPNEGGRELIPDGDARAGDDGLNSTLFSHTYSASDSIFTLGSYYEMDPPQFLLDALKASVTSGTFVDTKFYVFSRREVSGRVGSPRALYCNSRVLSTVPYFSACGYHKLIRHSPSNRTTPKCSQMHFRKDKRGT